MDKMDGEPKNDVLVVHFFHANYYFTYRGVTSNDTISKKCDLASEYC